MSEHEKKDTEQILLEILSTVTVLFLYWISMTPEWKIQYYLTLLRARFAKVTDPMPTEHRAALEQFRRELSSWEADQRRGNAGPR